MGARIAAHIANAGLPVFLLDIVPEKGDRNSLAAQAFSNLKKAQSPQLLPSPRSPTTSPLATLRTTLPRLRDCDWVIEAVAENLEIKRTLLSRVAPHLRREAIFTTNTSGLPVCAHRRAASRAVTAALVWHPLL